MPLPVAIGGAALLGAGASIISGKKAAKAVKQGAQSAAASANQTDATNRYIFDTTRADYAPYRAVGTAALGKLASMYGITGATETPHGSTDLPSQFGVVGYSPGGDFQGAGANYSASLPTRQPLTAVPGSTVGMGPDYGGFQESPGYRFRVDEAMKAIERSAAARGSLRSGATMDAIQRRVQGEASSEYENFANRLAQLAGVGQNATAGSAAAGANYAAGTMQTARMSGDAAIAAGNARASGYANTGNAINQGIQNVAQAYLYNRGFGGSTPTSGWGTPGRY